MAPKRTKSNVPVSSSDSSDSYVSSEDEIDDRVGSWCTHCHRTVSKPTERAHRKFAPIHDEDLSFSDSDTSSFSEDDPLILAVPRMSTFVSARYELKYNL
jgi:hypothetical protein